MIVASYSIIETIALLLAGAFGSLAKDCLDDGKLMLPHVEGDALVLGFIGSAIVGAFVGYVVDGSLITAAMAGYTGSSVVKGLVISYKNGHETIVKEESSSSTTIL